MNSVRIGYGLTTFLSAFLLFQVQPMVARFILPWFGGTPDTWTTCLLFFQATLFAGYLYAWLLTRVTRPERQPVIHAAVLLGATLLLPIIPSPDWKESTGTHPALRIVLLLSVTVGLPYLALSATAPLVQRWFSFHERDRPYRFFSLSNLGSLLALVSYPLVIEPQVPLRIQAWMWSVGFVVFGVVCIASTRRFRPPAAAGGTATGGRSEDQTLQPPRLRDQIQWLVYSAVGSMMLLAATNQISQDVAVVPLLWVAPLALYLLTFILCFDNPRWYVRGLCTPLFLTLAVMALQALPRGANLHFIWQLLIYCGTMWVTCLICHGELARMKPPPEFLTSYYLWMAAGGALGGVFVAVLAPLMFPMLLEFEISLALCALILLVVYYRDRWRVPASGRSRVPWPVIYVLALTGVAIVALLNESRALLEQYGRNRTRAASGTGREPARILARTRNFYGALVVSRARRSEGTRRSMSHGRIVHGEQYEESALSRVPLTYYGTNSGVGFALLEHPRRHASSPEDRTLRIADIGMGVGTVAAYGQSGDRIKFFEINPDVIALARKHFTYVSDSAAQVEVVVGDGRLSLERECATSREPRHDVLIVDAFSGDAVPVHLLTRECFRTYGDRLAEDGILAFHVSSRFLDLTPLVGTLCAEMGLRTFWKDTPASPKEGTRRAFWVLATRNEAFLVKLESNQGFTEYSKATQRQIVWTDDHVNLLAIFRERTGAKDTPASTQVGSGPKP